MAAPSPTPAGGAAGRSHPALPGRPARRADRRTRRLRRRTAGRPGAAPRGRRADLGGTPVGGSDQRTSDRGAALRAGHRRASAEHRGTCRCRSWRRNRSSSPSTSAGTAGASCGTRRTGVLGGAGLPEPERLPRAVLRTAAGPVGTHQCDVASVGAVTGGDGLRGGVQGRGRLDDPCTSGHLIRAPPDGPVGGAHVSPAGQADGPRSGQSPARSAREPSR